MHATRKQAEERVENYQTIVGNTRKSLFWQMTLEYGILHRQMVAQWAAQCMERLEEAAQ